jgi:hypothetical protein
MFNLLLSTILLVMLSEKVYADIEVTFIEGAPKDRFVLIQQQWGKGLKYFSLLRSLKVK